MKIKTGFMLLLVCSLTINTTFAHPSFAHADTTTIEQSQQHQLKQALQKAHANAIILVDGKNHNHPIVISNRVKQKGKRAKAINPNRLFPIASFQKSMTGVAIEQLLHEKKLFLATPLSKYCPQVHNALQISVQQLLTHTSGLADSNDMAHKAWRRQSRLMNYTKNNYDSTGKPNQWHYANVNYGFLAIIIGKVSHESYYKYMKKNVLDPYHLKEARFYSQVKNKKKQITPSINVSYQKDMHEKGHPWHYLGREVATEYGAGDLMCSPYDYWRFVNEALLAKPTRLVRYERYASGNDTPYYAGLYIHPHEIHTNASYDGYSATMYSDWIHHKTIMVFSNNLTHKQMRSLAPIVYRIYYGQNHKGGFAY